MRLAKNLLIVIAVLAAGASDLSAQKTESNGLICSVGYVQKNEPMVESEEPTTSVRLVVTGGMEDHRQGLLKIRIRKAEDDTGKDLLPDKNERQECSLITDYRVKFDESHFEEDILELRGMSDKAEKIRELSGEIVMHVPELDPESKVVIPQIQKQMRKPLEAELLTKAGIQLMVMSAGEYLDRFADVLGLEVYRRMAQQRGESPGWDSSYNDYDLVLIATDPGLKMAGIEIVDGKGNRVDTFNKSCRYVPGKPQFYLLRPRQAVDNDTGLVIYLETEKSVVNVPFTLNGLQ